MKKQTVWAPFDLLPTCICCKRTQKQRKGQWWYLRNYYGVWGDCCDKCYDMIRRDAFGQPVNPAALTFFLLKYQQ